VTLLLPCAACRYSLEVLLVVLVRGLVFGLAGGNAAGILESQGGEGLRRRDGRADFPVSRFRLIEHFPCAEAPPCGYAVSVSSSPAGRGGRLLRTSRPPPCCCGVLIYGVGALWGVATTAPRDFSRRTTAA